MSFRSATARASRTPSSPAGKKSLPRLLDRDEGAIRRTPSAPYLRQLVVADPQVAEAVEILEEGTRGRILLIVGEVPDAGNGLVEELRHGAHYSADGGAGKSPESALPISARVSGMP